MACFDCEYNPCICESEEVQKDMLITVLDCMREKVMSYQVIMQNRVYMIKEDIVATISEETSKFQVIINSNICKLNTLMEEVQNMEEGAVLTPEVIDAMNFNMDLKLDTSQIQDGFNRALNGEFVIFRELLKSNS